MSLTYLEEMKHQAERLEAEGFTVKMTELFTKRIEELGRAPDDWDFADCSDHLLIEVSRGDLSILAYSSGERHLAMHELLGPNSAAEVGEWRNDRIPEAELALFRHFGDGVEFELLGARKFQFTVHLNGWFEHFRFDRNEQANDGVVNDACPTPNLLADEIIAWENEEKENV